MTNPPPGFGPGVFVSKSLPLEGKVGRRLRRVGRGVPAGIRSSIGIDERGEMGTPLQSPAVTASPPRGSLLGATTGIFLKLMTLPFGEGGPRPKGLASLRSGSEEVPTRRASRLCHDKGAKHYGRGPHPPRFARHLPQRGRLLGSPSPRQIRMALVRIWGDEPLRPVCDEPPPLSGEAFGGLGCHLASPERAMSSI